MAMAYPQQTEVGEHSPGTIGIQTSDVTQRSPSSIRAGFSSFPDRLRKNTRRAQWVENLGKWFFARFDYFSALRTGKL